MIRRMVEERIGEYLGPVDPEYDRTRHDWTKDRGGVNPKVSRAGWERILEMSADPDGWIFSPSGCAWFRVVNIGMYDGWPFWEPTPAIGYIGPLDIVEWAFFYDLSPHNTRKGKASPVWGVP